MGLTDGDLRFGADLPLWVLAGILAATAWIAVRGYRRHAGALSPRQASIMRHMRIAALALLVACAADPMLRIYYSEERGQSLAVLWDCSESMGVRDEASGASRMERAKAALRGPLEALSRDFRLRFSAFSRSVREADGPDAMTADGDATDISGALSQAAAAGKEGAPAGILLVSDGADTEKGDFQRATRMLRRAGLPVYAVGVGETSFPDLAVAQVKVRRIVAKDTLMRVEVAVEKRAFPDTTVPVRILHGGRLVAEKPVPIAGGSATTEFEFLPPASGFLELAVEVPVQKGEAIAANNRLPFAVTALARKLKVLYLEGTNRIEPYDGKGYRRKHPDWWEHQYLVQALEEDGDVEVRTLFREPPPEGADETGVKWVEHPAEGYPKTRRELFAYDVIICSDIEYKRFTEEQVKNTVDFVVEHGGGFVMIGGWTSFGAGGYDETPIDRILPVDMQGLGDGYREGEGIMEWELT
ncbi:MAG: glutamine amidotransferase, partial [Planctomycetota bacterium]|nr:glutamine amidotransferase [Planctomycetota bacterium]